MAIEAVFGALVALVVAVVSGVWVLSKRLSKLEVQLATVLASDDATALRLRKLEAHQLATTELHAKVAVIEAQCASQHRQEV